LPLFPVEELKVNVLFALSLHIGTILLYSLPRCFAFVLHYMLSALYAIARPSACPSDGDIIEPDRQ